MPDLDFSIVDVEVVPYAADPQLAFKLRVAAAGGEAIHTIALRCQIQIEVTRRQYGPREQERLRDLFGEPERWSQTLRNLLWVNTSLIVPQFSRQTVVDLPVTCTFDFNVAATKYFHGLDDGDLPLCFLFSGSAFYQNGTGALQVAPIPWEKESKFRLPVRKWHSLMETYYPNTAWLHLRKDVFERLYRYKTEHGIPTWEQALESMLPPPGKGGRT